MSVNYDTLAPDYLNYRVPDSRIEAAIRRHIPQGAKVLNVGAGQGSYEPEDCEVMAVEPSREMIARRSSAKVPAIQGAAENLPFDDNSFDVSLALLTIHHWQDVEKGLSEMRRVTRGKVIILTWNGDYGDFWLPDYLPEVASIDVGSFPSIRKFSDLFGSPVAVEIMEIPHDCTDGFMCAYWRRPEMYLNAAARQAISAFSRLSDVGDGLGRLRSDIDSGRWHRKYEALLSKAKLDCGYRLIVHDKTVA